MKILILGSQGFIGSNLVNYFIEKKCDIIGCDLIEFSTDEFIYHKVSILSSDFEDIFIQNIFKVCINASGSGNVGYSIENPLGDFEANTLTVFKILDCIKKHQPNCKYIHISSAAVYGNPLKLPINENCKLSPISPYGFHKQMSEIICKEYSKLFGVNVTVIRPFSVYGKGLKKQLFWDLCHKVRNSKDGSVSLLGTGMETRDFIYIDDLVELIYIIIKTDKGNFNVYNAASGVEISILEISKFIGKYFNNSQINFSGEVRFGDPINWLADISMIKSLGFSPKIDIESGINKYLDWFNEQYEIRK